jgi:FKBP-type peptidyl-prolyl cis-trans isomerase (trigger factor)
MHGGRDPSLCQSKGMKCRQTLQTHKNPDREMHPACRARRAKGGDLKVAQRGARMEDSLIVDFDVRDRNTGVLLPGLERKKHEIETMDLDTFLPGVIEQLFGMRVGEEKHIDFDFPDQWDPQEFAGIQATVRSY